MNNFDMNMYSSEPMLQQQQLMQKYIAQQQQKQLMNDFMQMSVSEPRPQKSQHRLPLPKLPPPFDQKPSRTITQPTGIPNAADVSYSAAAQKNTEQGLPLPTITDFEVADFSNSSDDSRPDESSSSSKGSHEGSSEHQSDSGSSNEEYPAEIHDIALLRKICVQVEHYLSDEYLSTDKYLLRQLRSKSEGYLSVKLLTSFKKIKKLTRNWRVTSSALKLSQKLLLSSDGCRVKRVEELPENLRRCRTMTSVLCIRVPDSWANLETISELFSPFGNITLARILKPGKPIPTDLRNYATQIPDMGRTCCAVVEFGNCDSAHQSCRVLRDKNLYSMRIALLGPRIRRTLYKPEKKKGISVQTAVASAVNAQNGQIDPRMYQQQQAQQLNRYPTMQNQQIIQYIQALTQAHGGQLPPAILQQIFKNPQCVAALLQQQQINQARQTQHNELIMQNMLQEQIMKQNFYELERQESFVQQQRQALSSAEGSSSESGVIVNKVKPPAFLCNLLDNIITSDNELDSNSRSRLASQVSQGNVQQQLSSIFDSPIITDAVRKASESQDFASASIWGYTTEAKQQTESNLNSIWANSGKDNSVW